MSVCLSVCLSVVGQADEPNLPVVINTPWGQTLERLPGPITPPTYPSVLLFNLHFFDGSTCFGRAYGTSIYGESPTFDSNITPLDTPWQWFAAPAFETVLYLQDYYYLMLNNGVVVNGPLPAGTIVLIQRRRTRGYSATLSGTQFKIETGYMGGGSYSTQRTMWGQTYYGADHVLGSTSYVVQ